MKLLLLLTVSVLSVKASGYTFEWTGGPIRFPNETIKAQFKSDGRYISKNMIATRAQIYKDDVYVALPRYKPGVAVTLAKMQSKNVDDPEPVLVPYPNFEIQNENHTDGLHSVVDIWIDSYGQLWVLDVGVINTLNYPTRKNPPKVVVFDLKTGEKLKTLDLSGLVVQASRLQYIVVDYGLDLRPFVYVSDASTRSILVFDVLEDMGYRFVLPERISRNKRDVLFAALLRNCNGNNSLILTYLSGSKIFSINTDLLRSGSASGNIQEVGVKRENIAILGTDGGSALFYRYKSQADIYRWDSNASFGSEEKVFSSPCCYIPTNVLPDSNRAVMWVLESNFPDFTQGTVGCGASQRLALMISDVPK
ncbi:hypothetical protein YQE_12078, partial [Dendroctonus ponderosae]